MFRDVSKAQNRKIRAIEQKQKNRGKRGRRLALLWFFPFSSFYVEDIAFF